MRVVSERRRLRRAIRWGSVGAVGMVIDLGITLSLLGSTHALVANAAGWTVAVTANFAGNYAWTYKRPDGQFHRQYISYVSLHGFGLAVRAGTILGLLAVGAGPVAATGTGIALAAAWNFAGTEMVFGGAGQLWFDIVEASNHCAHLVYSSRVRDMLQYTGLYNPIFALYTRGLSVAYPAAERSISINGATATLHTSGAVETVSVLHTLEKERDILARFVDSVGKDDHVVDVGANLGVFSALATDCGADVTAVEPHPPTAERARENLDDGARVIEAALGAEFGSVSLAVDQDAVGTQRPEVSDTGQWTVDQLPGDLLRSPDVLKVDVEGAEVAVLDGFEQTLAAGEPHTIIVEAHSGEASDAAHKRLSGAGYAVETIRSSGEAYLQATDDPRHGGALDADGDCQ